MDTVFAQMWLRVEKPIVGNLLKGVRARCPGSYVGWMNEVRLWTILIRSGTPHDVDIQLTPLALIKAQPSVVHRVRKSLSGNSAAREELGNMEVY